VGAEDGATVTVATTEENWVPELNLTPMVVPPADIPMSRIYCPFELPAIFAIAWS
jgi:hypothetical protein